MNVLTDPAYPHRRRAGTMLLLVTVLWGVSFPLMRAIWLLQSQRLPGLDSWFSTSATTLIRSAVAVVIMIGFSWRTLGRITRLEVWQGVGLGFFSAGGLLLQMDGLARISASASAFLTQSYCIFIPVFIAVRSRRWPPGRVAVSAALVMAGAAVLSEFDPRTLHLGRGESETLLGSLFFAGQILWLERPLFARNRVNHFTLAMFLTTVLVALPIGLVTARDRRDWLVAFAPPVIPALMIVLIICCTMICMLVMNHWQRHLPATAAGLIYAFEPVSASLFALFLPGWLSAWGAFSYPDEKATLNLLVGGGLITLANLLIQFQPSRESGRLLTDC